MCPWGRSLVSEGRITYSKEHLESDEVQSQPRVALPAPSRGWASGSVALAEGSPTSSGCSAPSVADLLCSERDVSLVILCCWSFSQEEMLKFLSLSTMIMSHSPAKPGLGVWDFLELGGSPGVGRTPHPNHAVISLEGYLRKLL